MLINVNRIKKYNVLKSIFFSNLNKICEVQFDLRINYRNINGRGGEMVRGVEGEIVRFALCEVCEFVGLSIKEDLQKSKKAKKQKDNTLR
jgi:hypothetical protein